MIRNPKNKIMEYVDPSKFHNLDIRTGTVVEAAEFFGARKPAYKLTIDFGNEIGLKKTSAQITDLYKLEQLIGKQVIAVINLPAKQIGKYLSECLVLGAVASGGEVTLLVTDQTCMNGERIS